MGFFLPPSSPKNLRDFEEKSLYSARAIDARISLFCLRICCEKFFISPARL
jgi:hypothetical protein